MGEHSNKVTLWKSRREASEEFDPAANLILDFQPSNLCEKLQFCMPHCLWNFLAITVTSTGHDRL
jgi:hypothetical protein